MPSSGGGGSGSSLQTTKNVNEPPEYIKPMLQGGITDLNNLYMSRGGAGGAPEYYPNATVAPQSTETQQAISRMTNRGLIGSPLVKAAQGQLSDTIGGKYLNPSTNPYFSDALRASLAPQTENFMSTVLPGINSTFSGSGRYGSGLHQDNVDRAVTSLNRSQADASVKAGADHFNTERGRQTESSGMSPILASMDYADIDQLAAAGQAQDNFAQSKIDADVAKYNYNQNKDWDYIARYMAMLNGGYPGGTTTSTGTTTSQMPGQDNTGQMIGAGTSLAGSAMMAGAMFM